MFTVRGNTIVLTKCVVNKIELNSNMIAVTYVSDLGDTFVIMSHCIPYDKDTTCYKNIDTNLYDRGFDPYYVSLVVIDSLLFVTIALAILNIWLEYRYQGLNGTIAYKL
jgi:hypothetical protein